MQVSTSNPDIPRPVLDYLGQYTQSLYPVAYFLFGQEGTVLSRGGSASIASQRSDESSLPDIVSFIRDLLPLEGESVYLPDVGLTDGTVIDVHLFESDDGDWAVLRDVTSRHHHKKRIQQKLNHLALLQERTPLDRIAAKARGFLDTLRQLNIGTTPPTSVRPSTILAVHLSISFESTKPDHVNSIFDYIEQVMQLVRYQIHRKNGSVILSAVDRLEAAFFNGYGSENSAVSAIDCGLFILKEIDSFNKIGKLSSPPSLGIGISSGDVYFADVKPGRETETRVLGPPVDLAGELADASKPNEINIDPSTFSQTDHHGVSFRLASNDTPALGRMPHYTLDYHEHRTD